MLIKSISGIRGTIGGVPGEALTPPDVVKLLLVTRFGLGRKRNRKSHCCNRKRRKTVGINGEFAGFIDFKSLVPT